MNDYAKFLGFKGVLPGRNGEIVLVHGASLIVETNMSVPRQELMAVGGKLHAYCGAANFRTLREAQAEMGGAFRSIKVAVPLGGINGYRDIYTIDDYIANHMPAAHWLVTPPRPAPTPDWRKSLMAARAA